MYTYDHIIANAYYVFRTQLTPNIIVCLLTVMQKVGIRFHKSLKIDKLEGIIGFNGNNFYMLDGFKIKDCRPFLDEKLIVIFENIKNLNDKYFDSFKDVSESKQKKL